ncbi:MAG: hypothetical protein U9P49_06345 [Thermodesulfobacteriota bacterium]|nr:hypothetical protein [Thermodesulfobacteriota bacterium]
MYGEVKSMQEELDGFRPPQEYDEGVNYNKIICDFVAKKGCSYPAEMMRELGIYKDTLYVHLAQLVRDNWLEKHSLGGMNKAPSWLKHRLQELWDMNIKGDRIKMMAWYTLSGVGDTRAEDEAKSNEIYKKRTAIIDYWTNVHQGVEPSKEQKKASEDGKLTTDGAKIVPVEKVEKQ